MVIVPISSSKVMEVVDELVSIAKISLVDDVTVSSL